MRGYRAQISKLLERWFPLPKILMPPAAGIDISDASIKWLVLDSKQGAKRIRTYGELPIPEGVVLSGIVQDVERLSEALRSVRSALGLSYAHAALPEEAAYVFSMTIPQGTSRDQILKMIEFEFEGRVPIQPSQAVYDYSHIGGSLGETGEIGVVVFPKDVAEAYAQAFEGGGITLLSLEVEARSIARAVSTHEKDEPITLLVDFGRARTGFAVIKEGVPIFTSTVAVGGDSITKALISDAHLSPEEAEIFKNEKGLTPDEKSPGLEVISGTASALSDEVARHYHYWDTRRNERGERMTPVGRVILVGGNANLKGLPDYIAGRVQAKTEIGNVWRNVASYDDYIPPIDRRTSLQFATAIGLALRGTV